MSHAHLFPVRIYYEDTDHGGVVYHSNYLKFMERGRTELLRSKGMELNDLERSYGIVFAVAEANIRFLKPAVFNDLLQVRTQLQKCSGARMQFHQDILRHSMHGNTLLTSAEITVACLNRQGQPVRIPAHLNIEPTHSTSTKE